MDGRPDVLERGVGRYQRFPPKVDQDILTTPQVEQQVSNALVTVHCVSVEDKVYRWLRPVSQREAAPAF